MMIRNYRVLKKYLPYLAAIFLLALIIRFLNFHESIYFGYDEARDAFISQDIYLNGNFTLLGPQASAFSGIHHGPLYYYLIGPLFILGGGYPYLVSAAFRVLNALGIFGVFAIGGLLFSPVVGLIAAFLFAVSYEQYIYAIFAGNPSGSNISWILMFFGLALVWRLTRVRKLGLILMLLGASLVPQFDLLIGFSLFLIPPLLFLLKDRIKGIPFRDWIKIIIVGFSPLYTYFVSELKNNFIASKSILDLISNKTNIVREGDSIQALFFRNFLGLFRDNIVDYSVNNAVVTSLMTIVLGFLLINAKKNRASVFILLWVISMSSLMLAGGFMPFYSYAGVGVGLLIAASILLAKIFEKNTILGFVFLGLISLSNMGKSFEQSTKSLIVGIKAQPGMRLVDEIEIVRKTYEYSNNRPFTIRVTSMPYKIQTVWAYLYQQYGEKKHGYLPLYETGNVLGYEGELPVPVEGTTCHRFLIVEPVRGIPIHLINYDQSEENLFSEIVKEETIGEFVLQHRKSFSADCK